MATRNIVPRSNGEGSIGSAAKKWGDGQFTTLSASGLISANGGQIKFPATAVPSADPNTMDDYEEGDWTPSLEFGGVPTGITYSTQVGKYTKIGDVAIVVAHIILTNKGLATTYARIASLPFVALTIVGSGNGLGGTNYYSNMLTMEAFYIEPYITVLALNKYDATGVVNVDNEDFTDTTNLSVGAIYKI